jgi:hypothetical protein
MKSYFRVYLQREIERERRKLAVFILLTLVHFKQIFEFTANNNN